jgi:hypothetical protein
MMIPLLQTLIELGGKAKTKDIYPIVRKKMPKMTEEEVLLYVKSGNSPVWINRLQWTRQRLIERGEMRNAGRGIWEITKKGRDRTNRSI